MKQITLTKVAYFIFGFLFVLFGVMGYSAYGNYSEDTIMIGGWQLHTVSLMIFSMFFFIVGIGFVAHAIYIKPKVNKHDVLTRKGD